MLVIFATILALIGVVLLQDNGALTQHKAKQAAAVTLLFVSTVLYGLAFGALRGTFIFIGVISLLGTLFTLLRYKLDKA